MSIAFTVTYDTRQNLAGFVIGYREHHTPIAAFARDLLHAAGTARQLGDRKLAAEYLARAARERARFIERVTPAPPHPADELLPPGYRWEWSPMFRDWWIRPV